MRNRLVLLLVLVLAVAPWLVRADSTESPLDSATVLARSSRGVRANALTSGDLASRLRAIRATPYAYAPEASLVPLARIAAGRDPSLAPAAAVAAYRIANELSRASIEAHESEPEAIVEAGRAFTAIARDQSARPDVRRLAGYVASVLTSI